jgi:hypothetical protein
MDPTPFPELSSLHSHARYKVLKAKYAGFEVLMAASINMAVFLVLAL